jgi:hypothetical protein
VSAETRVHPTAIVHPTARLGVGVDIGPYAVIGPDVQLGDRVWVGPHAVIEYATMSGRSAGCTPTPLSAPSPRTSNSRAKRRASAIGARTHGARVRDDPPRDRRVRGHRGGVELPFHGLRPRRPRLRAGRST